MSLLQRSDESRGVFPKQEINSRLLHCESNLHANTH